MPEESTTTSRRTDVIFPLEVADAIDKLVGSQRDALRKAIGAWKDEDHPELRDGTAAWVRRIRAESEERFQGGQREAFPDA